MREPDQLAGKPSISNADADGRSNRSDRDALDYARLFEESADVLLVLLPDSPRFTMVAATNARLLATHTTRESLGRGLFESFPDNPDDMAAGATSNLRASLERVLETRRADTMPVQKYDIRDASGAFETKYWSPKNLPVLSSSGELLYILHRVEDVTELVRASELGDEMRGRTHAMEREVIARSNELKVALRQLRETNLELVDLDAAKTVFFNNISHEFRTPLALILGTLEDELSGTVHILPPHSRMQLKAAHRNGLRLLKLVNSLLDFARIEAGRMQANYQPTDLGMLTAELASVFGSAIERGGLSLSVDCRALPEPIYVDHEMWEKIILNLLSNALKHTFAGRIAVQLTWADGAAQLTVEDSGIGIAPADIPRLFDRFHRVEGAASRTHEGTGIGLALVRELVQLHAGHVQVESELGRGSRFTVTLQAGTAHLPADQIGTAGDATAGSRFAAPYLQEALQWLSPNPDGEDDEAVGAHAPAVSAVVPTWQTPRARILLADDNADMRAYVTRLLARCYDVVAVPDGQAALEAALASPPDLILSDVMMPRLDGFGLLRALRADDRTRRLPIILLSARAGEESTVAGLDTGADDYLVKPFLARELLARVRTHVELSWQRRAWENELERRVQERTAQLAEENSRRDATERKLQAQLQRMNLLDQITRAIAERQDMRGIFQVAIRSVEDRLPADACWIGLPEAEGERARLASGPIYEPDVKSASLALPKEIANLELGSLITVPLQAEGQLLGVLLAGRRQPNGFTTDDYEFLRQLSEHLAIAARHGQLRESLQAAYDDLHLTQPANRHMAHPSPTVQIAESPPLSHLTKPRVSSR